MPIQHVATVHDYGPAFQPGTYVWKDHRGLVVNIGKTTSATSSVLSRNLQQSKVRVHREIARRGKAGSLYRVGSPSCENVLIAAYTVLTGRLPEGQAHPGRPLAGNQRGLVLNAPDLRAHWQTILDAFNAECAQHRRELKGLDELRRTLTGNQRVRVRYAADKGILVGCDVSSTRTGTNWEPVE